jgi:hypothetical protein
VPSEYHSNARAIDERDSVHPKDHAPRAAVGVDQRVESLRRTLGAGQIELTMKVNDEI